MSAPQFPRFLRLLTLSASLLGTTHLFSACTGLNRQREEGRNFQNCTFALQSIDQVKLAGVEVTNIRSAADLTGPDRARILAAYATGALPLTMQVNLQVTNPNDELAAVNAMDYKLSLDGKEIATGATSQRIEVPAHSASTVALPITADARKIVNNGGAEALGEFALGIADPSRQPSRVSIAVRPTVNVLGTTIKSPTYITVGKEVTAQQLLNKTTAPN